LKTWFRTCYQVGFLFLEAPSERGAHYRYLLRKINT
jgi:hypothetical protein